MNSIFIPGILNFISTLHPVSSCKQNKGRVNQDVRVKVCLDCDKFLWHPFTTAQKYERNLEHGESRGKHNFYP